MFSIKSVGFFQRFTQNSRFSLSAVILLCALHGFRISPWRGRPARLSGFTELPLLRLHRSCCFADPLFLPCQKKWAKRGAGCGSDCTAVPQNKPVEEHCGQHTKISLQSCTTAPPAWRQRSHRKQLPRMEMAKHAAEECSTHLWIRRWCIIFAFYCTCL